MTENNIVIAVPKGRILKELLPLLKSANIEPEQAFFDKDSRQLQFLTNQPHISIIRIRSFDVATFVAFGAAQIGIAGKDVTMEFDNPEIYAPLDLGIGKCRLSVAEPKEIAEADDPSTWGHIRIATKYPNITNKYFANKGIQAECIKLSGAMELAPSLGLCRRIVDLVSSGKTLEENNLTEIEKIADISSQLITNRAAAKTKSSEINEIIQQFEKATNG